MHVTYKAIDKTLISKGVSNIGKPIPTLKGIILDQNQQLTPMGVVGELYVGGAGLSRGYLHRPELTKERFIHKSFDGVDSSRWYKTGDLVRSTEKGEWIYVGRADSQVKIRGYRIELGEIETVLLQSPIIEQCLVLVQENSPQDKYLVAYIVPTNKDILSFDKQSIFDYLKEQLPAYMIPSGITLLETFPLTINGKIDRQALPSSINHEQELNFVAASTDLELKLATIWQDLLKVDQLSIHANFFELGGHSLLATQVVSAIREVCGLEIAIKDLFSYTTIYALAKKMEQLRPTIYAPQIVSQKRPKKIPLSFSQERLWFIDKLQGSINYHIPMIFQLEGNLNIKRLRQTFKIIIQRHEILRTVYQEDKGVAYQYLKSAEDWMLTYSEFTSFADSNKSTEVLKNSLLEAFDLTSDFLLRGHLIKTGEATHLLAIVIHHIATDGWSMSLITKELITIYNALKVGQAPILSELKIQYADYAIWQRNHFTKSVLSEQLNYWETQLAGVTTLDLPTDYPRPPIQSTKGKSRQFLINKQLAESLETFSTKRGVTVFMTILAAFKVLLYRYSGQTDICIGSPIANRTLAEIESLVGFFVNTLALRSNLDGNPTFSTLLQQVKKTTLDAYNYCLLYTSPSPRDATLSRMPSSA